MSYILHEIIINLIIYGILRNFCNLYLIYDRSPFVWTCRATNAYISTIYENLKIYLIEY